MDNLRYLQLYQNFIIITILKKSKYENLSKEIKRKNQYQIRTHGPQIANLSFD